MYKEIEIEDIIEAIPSSMRLLEYDDQSKTKSIKIGITDFTLMGKPVQQKVIVNGRTFQRKYTDSIPNELAGSVCSVQYYELED